MTEQTQSHPVLTQFTELKEKIKGLTQEELNTLSEDVEFQKKMDSLKSEINTYINGEGLPTLTEADIHTIVKGISNNIAAQDFLIKELGLDVETFKVRDKDNKKGEDLADGETKDHGLFDKDDFLTSEDNPDVEWSPTVTDPADAPTVPSGDSSEIASIGTESNNEKFMNAKEDFKSSLQAMALNYYKTKELGEVPPINLNSAESNKMLRAMSEVFEYTDEDQALILTHAEIGKMIREASGEDPEVIEHLSSIFFQKLLVSRISDDQLTLDEFEGQENVFSQFDLQRSIIRPPEVTAEAKELNLSVAERFFSNSPATYMGLEKPQIKRNLEDTLERILNDPDLQDQYDKFLRHKAGSALDSAKGVGSDIANANVNDMKDSFTQVMNNFWPTAGEKVKDDITTLTQSLGISVFDVFDKSKDSPAGYKVLAKIDDVMEEIPNLEDRADVFKDKILSNENAREKLEGILGGKGYKGLLNPRPTKNDEKYFAHLDLAKLKEAGINTDQIEGYVESIDSVYRGTEFANKYVEYLAKSIYDGNITKPFHEWLDQDSNITSLQQFVFSLKGIFKTLSDSLEIDFLAKTFGEDSMVAKFFSNENDDNNPHWKDAEEAGEVVEETEEQKSDKLAEWIKPDNNAVKGRYALVANLVGNNIEGVKTLPEGITSDKGALLKAYKTKDENYEDLDLPTSISNNDDFLKNGISLDEFTNLEKKNIGIDPKFSLAQFILVASETMDDIGEKTITEWRELAESKDGEDLKFQTLDDVEKKFENILSEANAADEKEEVEKDDLYKTIEKLQPLFGSNDIQMTLDGETVGIGTVLFNYLYENDSVAGKEDHQDFYGLIKENPSISRFIKEISDWKHARQHLKHDAGAGSISLSLLEKIKDVKGISIRDNLGVWSNDVNVNDKFDKGHGNMYVKIDGKKVDFSTFDQLEDILDRGVDSYDK